MKRSTAIAIACLLLSGCERNAGNPQRSTADSDPSIRCENAWVTIAKGIEYRTLNCSGSHADLHLIRVDPKQATIDAVIQPGGTAAGVARSRTFAVNANFFDEQFQPIGVVASGGKLLRSAHPVTWQSVFCITRKRTPRIVRATDWDSSASDVVTAAQAGPRLVVGGARNDVARARPDSRSGVCIDPQNRVVFFVTGSGTQFDVQQMVDLAHDTLGCRDAMLFDGGPSAQLYLNRPGAAVNIEGDKSVPVFVVGAPLSSS